VFRLVRFCRQTETRKLLEKAEKLKEMENVCLEGNVEPLRGCGELLCLWWGEDHLVSHFANSTSASR